MTNINVFKNGYLVFIKLIDTNLFHEIDLLLFIAICAILFIKRRVHLVKISNLCLSKPAEIWCNLITVINLNIRKGSSRSNGYIVLVFYA